MKKSVLSAAKAADQSNLEAARTVLELWDKCDGFQREWAGRCLHRLGTLDDLARLEELQAKGAQ
jgi:hypothetical protein